MTIFFPDRKKFYKKKVPYRGTSDTARFSSYGQVRPKECTRSPISVYYSRTFSLNAPLGAAAHHPRFAWIIHTVLHEGHGDQQGVANRLPPRWIRVRGESCKDCSVEHAEVVRVVYPYLRTVLPMPPARYE